MYRYPQLPILYETKDYKAARELLALYVESQEGEPRYMRKPEYILLEAFLRTVDLEYAIQQFFIVTKAGLTIPLTLSGRYAQLALLKEVMEDYYAGTPMRYIVLKARQMGISTLVEALIYWLSKIHLGTSAFIYSYENSNAEWLSRMFQIYSKTDSNNLIFCPDPSAAALGLPHILGFFHNRTARAVTKKVRWDCGGLTQISSAYNKLKGHGFTAQYLHLSEVARWQEPQRNMQAALDMCSYEPYTFECIESTARGMNYFHDLWKTTGDRWKRIFLAWFKDPTYREDFITGHQKYEFERSLTFYEKTLMSKFPEISLEQMRWRRSKRDNDYQKSDVAFGEQYPAYPEEAFISSGRSFFTIPMELSIDIGKTQPTRFEVLYNANGTGYLVESPESGRLCIFKQPRFNGEYVMGVDVSEGVEVSDEGGKSTPDNSCIQVLDRGDSCNPAGSKLEQVAEWTGIIEPSEIPQVIKVLHDMYGRPPVLVESNGHGNTTIAFCMRLDINLMQKPDVAEQPKMDVKVSYGAAKVREYGWKTTLKSRPVMLDYTKEMFNQGFLAINSPFLLEEMYSFGFDKIGKMKAEKGKHDDRVLALAVAVMADRYANRRYKQSVATPDMDVKRYLNRLDEVKSPAEMMKLTETFVQNTEMLEEHNRQLRVKMYTGMGVKYKH